MKTKSEDVFEAFLTDNNVPFEKIKEEASPGPTTLSMQVARKSCSRLRN